MSGAHVPLPPWAAWAGPHRPKMLLIGEAWGEAEAQVRQPFAGQSGRELWRMLGEALPDEFPQQHLAALRAMKWDLAWVKARREWLEATGIAFTNVLALRPPGNQLAQLCGPGPKEWGADYKLPPIGRSGKDFPLGSFLRPEFGGELARLAEEIHSANPNLIVPMGNTAMWATLQVLNIGSIRGNTALSTKATGQPEWPDRPFKTLPTYHPAGVLRQWSWRPIVVADLIKAWREAQFPELRRPQRQIIINPTLPVVRAWTYQTLIRPPQALAVDIETAKRQITCIGFARSRGEALVVPFMDLGHPSGCYWPSASAELEAWGEVQALLESPIPKIFQNGMYDLQYILAMGFAPKALLHDTMLLHHSLFPEMQKGLGFLGSIYTNEASWKLMRRPKADTEKRDE